MAPTDVPTATVLTFPAAPRVHRPSTLPTIADGADARIQLRIPTITLAITEVALVALSHDIEYCLDQIRRARRNKDHAGAAAAIRARLKRANRLMNVRRMNVNGELVTYTAG